MQNLSSVRFNDFVNEFLTQDTSFVVPNIGIGRFVKIEGGLLEDIQENAMDF
jgi:hypothetical protein